MKTIALNLALSTLLLSTAAATAQSDTMWDKSYAVTGQPSLFLSTGDSHLNIHPCASCQTVHIHVTAENTSLSRYTLEEDQSGNTVHFSLKESLIWACISTCTPHPCMSMLKHRQISRWMPDALTEI